MSDISSISSSLLTNLLGSQQSNATSSVTGLTQGSSSAGITDIVSLLGGSGGAPTDSLYGLLGSTQGSDSTDNMYSLLLAGANAQLMKDNPGFVQAILSADQGQAQTAGDASSNSTQSNTTGTQILQDLQNTNLLTMNPESLVSLLQKYLQSKNGAAAEETSGSQINQTV